MPEAGRVYGCDSNLVGAQDALRAIPIAAKPKARARGTAIGVRGLATADGP